MVSWQPKLSVTTRLIWYIPKELYVWEGFCTNSFTVLSPKFHSQEITFPSEKSFKLTDGNKIVKVSSAVLKLATGDALIVTIALPDIDPISSTSEKETKLYKPSVKVLIT